MCNQEPNGAKDESAGGSQGGGAGEPARRTWSRRIGKVEQELSPEDLKVYEPMANDPKVTDIELRRWLKSRGYTIGRRAVSGHRAAMLQAVKEIKRSARTTATLANVLGNGRRSSLGHLAQARLEQLLIERLFAVDADGKLCVPSLEDLETFAAVVGKSSLSRARLDGSFYRWEKALAAAPVDMDAAYRDVSNRVRTLLGIGTDDDPVPEDLDLEPPSPDCSGWWPDYQGNGKSDNASQEDVPPEEQPGGAE